MTLDEAILLAKEGYKITHPEMDTKFLYYGECNMLRGGDYKLINNPTLFLSNLPITGNWSIYRNSKIIFFKSVGDRDSDASKCEITESRDGDIKIKTYDCIDYVCNKIKINDTGLAKLRKMQEALSYAEELLTRKLKSK